MNAITPQEFIEKWRNVTLNERSVYQSHFIDLCRLMGHKQPLEMDPVGDTFRFEAGASKTSGGQGFADVWFRDHFAWEYKGPHANLDKAYQQLLLYREALGNPPLLIVSDIQTIQVHTNFTGTMKKVHVITLDDLLDPAKRSILHSAFYDPYSLRVPLTPAQVTEQAAAHFATLADMLRGRGYENAQIAHFLIRILFCLFSEDTDLLPRKLFSNMVANFRGKPTFFTMALSGLFAAMSNGGIFGTELIFNFDGRLFDDAIALELPAEALDVLLEVSGLDWGSIDPTIFGTLFERSLDPAKRSQLGAHYTSKDDIELIVEPVLMAPLRREWVVLREEALALANERDELAVKHARAALKFKPDIAKSRNAKQRELTEKLDKFAEKLTKIHVLDAACGSGNFLYIALLALLDLWNEVSNFSASVGLTKYNPGLAPTPAQLHGIEINETAHQLAQAVIQIGYIQWLRQNGYGHPSEPIFKPLDTIRLQDAILAYDEQGKPCEPEWPDANVIIGNPPFLGDKKMRAELGDQYVNDLRKLYGTRIPGQSDLVCYWFEKARQMVELGIVKRVGLLATQGIRGGANRVVLDRVAQTGNIFWAHSDRDWILDGATVHVSMVAFDGGAETSYELNGQNVPRINPDLTYSVDLTSAKLLPENAGIAFIGTQKGGDFDIPWEIARQMLNAPINPHGCSNSDVIKPWVNGFDLVNRLRGMYIIDFGVDMKEEEAALYQMPFEYVRKFIKQKREDVKSEGRTAELWWLHQRPRPEMRKALEEHQRYVATPRVSKHRIFVWLDAGVLSDSAVVVIARSDDYFIGVLQSRIHELWARGTGTQLREAESGFRYSQTMTFETFPFPWPPGQEPVDDPRYQEISRVANRLVALRDNWLNPPDISPFDLQKRTLTNLYNKLGTGECRWLELIHLALDRTVLDAYGWPHDLSDDDILENLLKLNKERAGNG